MMRYFWAPLFLFISCNKQYNDVVLPGIFSDGMVLQKDTTVAIWGYASPNQAVHLFSSWGSNVSTISDNDGKWHANLETESGPGPYSLKITSRMNQIKIENILLGEVWLAAGQSNMEMTFDYCCNSTDSSKVELSTASYPDIRMFNVKKNLGAKPNELIEGNWTSALGSEIINFSAVGYFFAKELNKKLGVPIGIINSSWGSSNAEAWTSFDAISGLKEYEDEITSSEDLILNSQESMDWYSNFKEIPMPSHDWDFFLDKIIDTYDPDVKYLSYFFHKWSDLDEIGNNIIQNPGIHQNWVKMNSSMDVDRTLGTKNFKGITIFKNEFIANSSAQNILTIEPDKNLPGLWEYDIFINGKRVASSLIGIEIEDYKIPKELETYSIQPGIIKNGANHIVVRVLGYSKLSNIKILNDNRINILDNNKWNFTTIAEEYHQLKDFKYPYTSFYLFGDTIINHSKSPGKSFYGRRSLSSLYNGMINPLIPYTIRGVIWYQGESNVEVGGPDFHNFKKLMPVLIDDWRKRWGNEFPFYFAQLANYFNYGGMLSAFRSAQINLLKTISNTGMVVTLDIGENYDIHPSNKHDVGYRFAQLALNRVYGANIIDSGPLFTHFEKENNKIHLHFEHIGSGLKINHGKEKTWFEIAGKSKKYYEAQVSNQVSYLELFSPLVKNPEYVRYAWSDTAAATLFNMDGLPASPFSSEYK